MHHQHPDRQRLETYVQQLVEAGASSLPDAKAIHDLLRIRVHKSTTRRWVEQLEQRYGISRGLTKKASKSARPGTEPGGTARPGGSHRRPPLWVVRVDPAATSDEGMLTWHVPASELARLSRLAERMGMNLVTTAFRALRILEALEHVVAEDGEVVLARKDGSRERLLLT